MVRRWRWPSAGRARVDRVGSVRLSPFVSLRISSAKGLQILRPPGGGLRMARVGRLTLAWPWPALVTVVDEQAAQSAAHGLPQRP